MDVSHAWNENVCFLEGVSIFLLGILTLSRTKNVKNQYWQVPQNGTKANAPIHIFIHVHCARKKQKTYGTTTNDLSTAPTRPTRAFFCRRATTKVRSFYVGSVPLPYPTLHSLHQTPFVYSSVVSRNRAQLMALKSHLRPNQGPRVWEAMPVLDLTR